MNTTLPIAAYTLIKTPLDVSLHGPLVPVFPATVTVHPPQVIPATPTSSPSAGPVTSPGPPATKAAAAAEEAMDVVVAKIIALLVLTVLSVLCGLLPLRLLIHLPHLFGKARNSLDYFLCGLRLFSGGE